MLYQSFIFYKRKKLIHFLHSWHVNFSALHWFSEIIINIFLSIQLKQSRFSFLLFMINIRFVLVNVCKVFKRTFSMEVKIRVFKNNICRLHPHLSSGIFFMKVQLQVTAAISLWHNNTKSQLIIYRSRAHFDKHLM